MKYNFMLCILNLRPFGLLNHAERMPDHAASNAVLATAAQLGLICCRRKGEESLLLQDKYNPGMWLQIQNSSLPSTGWCVENKTQHDVGFWS